MFNYIFTSLHSQNDILILQSGLCSTARKSILKHDFVSGLHIAFRDCVCHCNTRTSATHTYVRGCSISDRASENGAVSQGRWYLRLWKGTHCTWIVNALAKKKLLSLVEVNGVKIAQRVGSFRNGISKVNPVHNASLQHIQPSSSVSIRSWPWQATNRDYRTRRRPSMLHRDQMRGKFPRLLHQRGGWARVCRDSGTVSTRYSLNDLDTVNQISRDSKCPGYRLNIGCCTLSTAIPIGLNDAKSDESEQDYLEELEWSIHPVDDSFDQNPPNHTNALARKASYLILRDASCSSIKALLSVTV